MTTAGTGAFNMTFGAAGIKVNAGTGHKIYHNSVHLCGVLPGATSTDMIAALGVVTASSTGMDIRNNIFSNIMTGGNPTQDRHAACRRFPAFRRHGCHDSPLEQ